MTRPTTLALASVALMLLSAVLHARRQPATQPALDAGQRAILMKRIPELRLDNSAFVDVVDFLRDISGANLFVNWRALEGVGIDRNAPVSVNVRDVTLDKALRLVLDEVSGGTVRLAYAMDENVIHLSTEEDIATNLARGAAAALKAAPAPSMYYVSGVEQAGVYALSSNTITLKQALIAAGGPDIEGKHVIIVHHDPRTGATSRQGYAIDDLTQDRGMGSLTVQKDDVLMVMADPPADPPPATEPAADKEPAYFVSGDVPRDGKFALPEGQRVTMLQSLIAAGADPPTMEDKLVSVRRGDHVVFRSKVTDLVMFGEDEMLRAGDIVSVTDAPP